MYAITVVCPFMTTTVIDNDNLKFLGDFVRIWQISLDTSLSRAKIVHATESTTRNPSSSASARNHNSLCETIHKPPFLRLVETWGIRGHSEKPLPLIVLYIY